MREFIACAALGMMLSLAPLSAGEWFKNDKRQTWFYKVGDPEPEESDEQNVSKRDAPQHFEDRRAEEERFMRSIPFDHLDKLTAKQYREMLDKTKDIATMHPTEQNVATYMRLQKFATDQADTFTTMWKKAAIQDPSLTYSISTSKVGRDLATQGKDEDIQAFLGTIQGKATFIMFYDEGRMKEAQAQVNIYRKLEKSYGLKIATVSIQKNPEYIKTLELQSYPEHWVYYDDGKRASWQRIGTGFLTMDALVNNYYFLRQNP